MTYHSKTLAPAESALVAHRWNAWGLPEHRRLLSYERWGPGCGSVTPFKLSLSVCPSRFRWKGDQNGKINVQKGLVFSFVLFMVSIVSCLIYCFSRALFLSLFFLSFFLVADTQLYKRLCPSVGPSVRLSVQIGSKNGKTRITAPAHPSATDGRVSGLFLRCTLT